MLYQYRSEHGQLLSWNAPAALQPLTRETAWPLIKDMLGSPRFLHRGTECWLDMREIQGGDNPNIDIHREVAENLQLFFKANNITTEFRFTYDFKFPGLTRDQLIDKLEPLAPKEAVAAHSSTVRNNK